MTAIRHADLASTARAMLPAVPSGGVRPAMRPGTTDKASTVAHYRAMAEQVAFDRLAGHATSAVDAADTTGVQRRG